MGTQGQALASKLQDASNQLIATVEKCPEEKWQATTTDAEWSIGVTAHHAANSIASTTGLVAAIATGQPLPNLTFEMINAGNAQHAQEFAGCTKAETLELARTGTAQAAGMLSGLSDEQLATTAVLPLLGSEAISAAQLGEMLAVGHLVGHLQSIQAAL